MQGSLVSQPPSPPHENQVRVGNYHLWPLLCLNYSLYFPVLIFIINLICFYVIVEIILLSELNKWF